MLFINMHKCNICEKSYKGLSKFRRHMNYHRGFREFKCKVCGKEFVEIYNKDRHEKTHKGENV